MMNICSFIISIFGDICCRYISTSGQRFCERQQPRSEAPEWKLRHVSFCHIFFFCHILFFFKIISFVTFSFSSKSLFCHIFPFFKVSWTIFSFCLLGHIFFFFKIDKCVNLLPRYITKKGYNMTVIMKRIR